MIHRWCAALAVGALLSAPAIAQQRDDAPRDTADGGKGAPAAQTGAANSSDSAPGKITPRFESYAGYSYVNFDPGTPFDSFSNQGSTGGFTYNPSKYVGLTGEFSGYTYSRNVSGNKVNGGWNTWLFGPRLNMRRDYFVPFAEILFGGAHGDVQINGAQSKTTFAIAAGGGVDIILTRGIAWRFAQIDYLMTNFGGPNLGSNNLQNNLRLGTGIVFRFGFPNPAPRPEPKGPPIISCQANPTSVFAESNDSVAVHVNASSPDNLPLTFSYIATGGTIDGNGPDARWNSSGVATGSYTVNIKANDSKGATASCAVDIRVEERPHHPPTLSCTANPASIKVGEHSAITCAGNSPDNLPLTYTYSPSGGQITGNGPTVQFDSTGAQPGTYTVKAEVTDSRGDKAQSSANVEVTQAAPPAEQVRLETRLALHSVYFPTAQPTVANPNGGLTASQRETLDTLANDFKQYLTYRSDAHLILEGHADIRGAKEYNDLLSQRRVERVKSYLIEKGVPADHIETRAFGFEKNMSSEEVRKLVESDSDLSAAEKQKLIRNILTVRLANNRRVDVTLSTTGEQSVRKFPFNARDALTLLSRTGPGGTTKKNAPAPKKKPTP